MGCVPDWGGWGPHVFWFTERSLFFVPVLQRPAAALPAACSGVFFESRITIWGFSVEPATVVMLNLTQSSHGSPAPATRIRQERGGRASPQRISHVSRFERILTSHQAMLAAIEGGKRPTKFPKRTCLVSTARQHRAFVYRPVAVSWTPLPARTENRLSVALLRAATVWKPGHDRCLQLFRAKSYDNLPFFMVSPQGGSVEWVQASISRPFPRPCPRKRGVLGFSVDRPTGGGCARRNLATALPSR